MKHVTFIFCLLVAVARLGAQVTVSGNVRVPFTPLAATNNSVSTWVPGNQPPDLTCREVCWADTLGLFIAVSDTLGKAMTSADGLNYNIQSCGPNEWEALCWSHELGLLVALGIDGTGNRAMTSTNGTNWVNRNTAGDSTWLGLCWSPEKNLFVGVGYGAGGAIMTSANGVSWFAQSGGGVSHWTDVCWSPERSLFVACSESAAGNDIMTSPNGTNWAIQTYPSPNRVLEGLTWSPQLGIFVIVTGSGTGNRVMTSTNGTNWVNQVSAADNDWSDVAWGAGIGQFVAVGATGTGNRIMTSPDGTNWTSHAAPNPFNHEYRWASIAYSPQLPRFSAVSDIGDALDITTKRVMANSAMGTLTPVDLRIVIGPGGSTNPPSSSTNVWVQQFGSTGTDTGSQVIMDGTNLLVVGTFSSTMTIGSQVLTNAGGRDIFMALINTNGTAQWAKRYGTTGDEFVTAVDVDDSGNIYLGGYFGGAGNFGGSTTTSAGGWDFFMAKYNSTGNFVWSSRVGGTSDDVITCLTLDQYKTNILVGGHYQGTVNFGNTNHSSFDTGTDSFVAKYSAASGAPVWAQTWFNRGYDTAIGVKVDSSGSLYIAGYIGTRINFGNGLLTTVGGTGLNDIYMAKWPAPGVTPLGIPTWSKLAGSTNGESTYAFNLDSSGDLVVGGTFSTYTDLGGGRINGTGADTDMFLAKYSGVDGSYIWQRGLLCTQGGAPRGISFDSSKNPVVCGYFYGACNFGGVPLVSMSGSQDAFISKYTTGTGAYIWDGRGGGTLGEDCGGIVVDPYNYPVVTGSFSGSAGFDGTNLTSFGFGDVFLWRHLP